MNLVFAIWFFAMGIAGASFPQWFYCTESPEQAARGRKRVKVAAMTMMVLGVVQGVIYLLGR